MDVFLSIFNNRLSISEDELNIHSNQLNKSLKTSSGLSTLPYTVLTKSDFFHTYKTNVLHNVASTYSLLG